MIFGVLPSDVSLHGGLFRVFRIAGSGLTAEQLRGEVIANNIANANTTRTEKGTPYIRKTVVFMPRQIDFIFNIPILEQVVESPGLGVRVVDIEEDKETPFRLEHNPGHPDADKDGYVKYPNVNVVMEMVDLISAQRAYEANISVIQTTKSMLLKTLQIGQY